MTSIPVRPTPTTWPSLTRLMMSGSAAMRMKPLSPTQRESEMKVELDAWELRFLLAAIRDTEARWLTSYEDGEERFDRIESKLSRAVVELMGGSTMLEFNEKGRVK